MAHAVRQPGTGPFIACLALLAACGHAHAQQTRLYVNAAAPEGGNGLSWSTAYRSLLSARNHASYVITVREVWVAQGTYIPASDAGGDRNVSLYLVNNVGFYG